MAGFEEETYSTVFAALKHPIRRKILRVLSKSSKSFTDMQNSLNINSPVLTYHLEALRDLISKTEEGKYRLSSAGEGAAALMERVEEAPKNSAKNLFIYEAQAYPESYPNRNHNSGYRVADKRVVSGVCLFISDFLQFII